MSQPAATDDAPRVARPVPWLALAAVVALLAPLRAGMGPIRDIDSYWHLLVGREILDGAPVADAGHGWSMAPVADTWVSAQWLAEVVLAKLEHVGGLHMLLVYRVVTLVAAMAVLAVVTLVRRPVRPGVLAFTLGSLMLSITAQERSQQLTFLLAPLVGWWAERLWRDGRLPRWWVVLPLVVVWSNWHGGWVILPVALVLAALARALDHGWRDRTAAYAVLLAVGTFAAACVSPSGISNALAVLRFSSSTALILEWQPVTFWDWSSIAFVPLLLAIVVAWARGRVRPSRGELLLVLALVAFATLAWRNLAPATLMLAPITVGIVARAMGEDDPAPAYPRPRLWRTTWAAGGLGLVLGVFFALTQTPVVDTDIPTSLLARLKDASAPQRVIDTYNVSGPLLWFAGPPPHVVVGIDGRADRYGGDYVRRYQGGLLEARPGWQSLYDELRPTSALLLKDEPLAGVLVSEKGWVEVATEGDYVLLRAPDAPGWT
ncbi:MAG TPA: hypothetical protein VFL59_11975 [Candidatus Nanopelagicales bacterium]|nr:hypothetical protein [Candidatus Nanopelagicales bacterium]